MTDNTQELHQALQTLHNAWRHLRARDVADENGNPTTDVAAMDVVMDAAVQVKCELQKPWYTRDKARLGSDVLQGAIDHLRAQGLHSMSDAVTLLCDKLTRVAWEEYHHPRGE